MLVAGAAYWTYVRREDPNARTERPTRIHGDLATAHSVLRRVQSVDGFYITQPKNYLLSDVAARALKGDHPREPGDHIAVGPRMDTCLPEAILTESTRLSGECT